MDKSQSILFRKPKPSRKNLEMRDYEAQREQNRIESMRRKREQMSNNILRKINHDPAIRRAERVKEQEALQQQLAHKKSILEQHRRKERQLDHSMNRSLMEKRMEERSVMSARRDFARECMKTNMEMAAKKRESQVQSKRTEVVQERNILKNDFTHRFGTSLW
eukprot:TRINITY_DN781856_c0_g1_i1.p1 TRINITY_DN781856_c0_g1~~TRINITY_DN781856_c0_g1_i1.p1  ORF type:complete len:163 (+),score=41.10 TRINITY_DN781856_c0_g1_i1:49-537(+)